MGYFQEKVEKIQNNPSMGSIIGLLCDVAKKLDSLDNDESKATPATGDVVMNKTEDICLEEKPAKSAKKSKSK